MSAALKIAANHRLPKYLKGEVARVARLGREAAGLSQRHLAAQLAVQPSHVARTELAAEPHTPTITHVAVGPTQWSEALLRWAARPHRLQVLASVEIKHGNNHLARLASVTAESTDVVRAFTAALASGNLNDTALELLAQEAREEALAALELEAWAAEELAARRQRR